MAAADFQKCTCDFGRFCCPAELWLLQIFKSVLVVALVDSVVQKVLAAADFQCPCGFGSFFCPTKF